MYKGLLTGRSCMLPTLYALKIKLLYRRVLHKREFKCKAIIKSITVLVVSFVCFVALTTCDFPKGCFNVCYKTLIEEPNSCFSPHTVTLSPIPTATTQQLCCHHGEILPKF